MFYILHTKLISPPKGISKTLEDPSREARDVLPGSKFFHLHAVFSQKNCKIIDSHIQFGSWRASQEHPGSSTERYKKNLDSLKWPIRSSILENPKSGRHQRNILTKFPENSWKWRNLGREEGRVRNLFMLIRHSKMWFTSCIDRTFQIASIYTK